MCQSAVTCKHWFFTTFGKTFSMFGYPLVKSEAFLFPLIYVTKNKGILFTTSAIVALFFR